MSASLVGSEMCIRDSPTPDPEPGLDTCQRGKIPMPEARECNRRAESARAVSYTHLTLPTICSV
eukprot:1059227-Alexandrium_andersonii.AAC.1